MQNVIHYIYSYVCMYARFCVFVHKNILFIYAIFIYAELHAA